MQLEDARFVMDHWREIGRDAAGRARHACDSFNPETRQCMAHEARPPMCRGFPWYGLKPSLFIGYDLYNAWMRLRSYPRCSYREDVGMPMGAFSTFDV